MLAIRFNLRTAFVLIAIIAVTLTGVRYNLSVARQRDAVQYLTHNRSATIGYEYTIWEGRIVYSLWPGGPRWVHHMLGRDFFGSPKYVSMSGTYLNKYDLEHLTRLRSIEVLELILVETGDENGRAIATLTNLKVLDLRGTDVRPEAIDRLKQALPHCVILSDPADTN